MPYLTVTKPDGSVFQLPQSVTIARYLAKEFKLAGKDNEEGAKADAIVDTVIDIQNDIIKTVQIKDEAKVVIFLHLFKLN